MSPRLEDVSPAAPRIRGYISTLRKQDYSVFAGLVSVFAGQPHIPRLTA
jgi:hypothetical protein